MSRWSIAERDERCGYDWCKILPGDPILVLDPLNGKRRIRCLAHAFRPLDLQELEQAKAAIRDKPEIQGLPPRSNWSRYRKVKDGKAAATGDE